jgi:hypothetical protein
MERLLLTGRRFQKLPTIFMKNPRTPKTGNVATYIPELGKADPKHFAICLAAGDGHVFSAVGWDKEFTRPWDRRVLPAPELYPPGSVTPKDSTVRAQVFLSLSRLMSDGRAQ